MSNHLWSEAYFRFPKIFFQAFTGYCLLDIPKTADQPFLDRHTATSLNAIRTSNFVPRKTEKEIPLNILLLSDQQKGEST